MSCLLTSFDSERDQASIDSNLISGCANISTTVLKRRWENTKQAVDRRRILRQLTVFTRPAYSWNRVPFCSALELGLFTF